MISHFLLDTLAGWIGVAGIVVVICALVFFYIPPLRGYALAVAGIVVSAASIYAKGNCDERSRWNDSIAKDVEAGRQARIDAEHNITSGSVSDDKWNRDKGGV